MEPNVLLRTPLAIEECINREFPDVIVQVDGEREVVNIALPPSLGLPNGEHVTISTFVIKGILIDVINEIAQFRLSFQEGSQALLTCTALSGWDEARSTLSERLRRRQFEQQHGSSTEWPLWSAGARYITRVVAPIGRAIVHVSSIGGLYPPNAQTGLVALTAITSAAACVGRMFSGPARVVSLLLRLTNIAVLAGRCQNPSFEVVTRFAAIDLAIYILAIPLLLIPGPWGVIASGAFSSIPEALAWLGKHRHDADPHGLSVFRRLFRDPKDLRVAREVFHVPEGEEPNQARVDQEYDWRCQHSLDRMSRAQRRENSLIVELERHGISFLNQAYTTLMGHPRSTGVD